MHLGQRAEQRKTSRILVRFRKSLVKLLALVILVLMMIPAIPAHAVPAYLPGVHVGDSVTFGQVSGNVAPFSDTKSIVETVMGVNGATVEVSQTYNLKNGTSQTTFGTVDVQTGAGSSSVFDIAGGLGAGDSLYQSGSSATSFFGIGFITETVSRVYAGALRSVNAEVVHTTQFGQTFDFAFYWDVSTGLLLDASVQFPSFSAQSAQGITVNFKVTSTNIWGSSTMPDFGFDAILHGSPLVYLGQSAIYGLNLTSFQNFSGPVSLTALLTNSSLSHHPVLTLGALNVNIPSAASATTTLNISTDPSTPLGLYLFSVRAVSSGSSHDALFAVSVQRPSFELLSTPPNLTIARGSTSVSTITVKALGTFSGTIGLSASPSNPSITTSLGTTTVSLSSTVASANSTMTVSVGAYAIPGQYSVYVTGTGGQSQQSVFGPQQSVSVPVSVAGPQFQLSLNASSLTIAPGTSATISITLTSISGFSGTVRLIDSSYGPAAISLSQTSIPLSAGGVAEAALTISVAPSAPQGSNIYVTITGISGLLEQSQSVFVTVPSSGPGFSITVSPPTLTVRPGQNGNFTIFLISTGGFSGHVALAAQFYGSPLGYVFSSTNVTVTPSGTANSILKVSAPATIPQGSSSINVYANSGNLSQQAFFSVNIGTPPVLAPDFDISAFPPTLLLASGTSGNSTITLDGLNGFSGNLALTVSLQGGPPSVCPGATCPTVSLTRSVLKLSSNGSNSTTVSVTVPSTTPHPSFYTVLVTATNGSLPHDTSVTVGACPCPSLQASFNTNFVTIIQGTSVSATLILSSFQGFSGTISLRQSLTVFGQNCQDSSCPSISLSPANVFLSANGTAISLLTIDTNSSTIVGRFYNVQVDATSSTFQTTTASLSVDVVRPSTPDFAISSAPSPLIITPGSSASLSIILTSLNEFSGKVTLSSSPGQILAVSPNSLNLTVTTGGSVDSILTISAQPSAPQGFNFVYLTGTSGTLTHAFYLPIFVAAPDFSTMTSLTSLTVQTGGKSNSTIITIPSLDGLQGSVSLDSIVQPCFSGICPTVSFNPPSVNLSPGGWTSSNVSVSAPTGTPPGSYFITVNVASGLLSHAVYLSVLVTGPTTFFPDFGVFASPSALTIAQGGSQDSTIAVNSLNGFSGTVTLSPATPPGITAVLASGSVSLTPGGTSSATLSVSVASTTATGFYSLTVTGTNGTVSHPVDIRVRVVGPDFTISANPDFLNVPQGESGVSTITVGSLAGFVGTVTLSASGDLATSFSPSTVLISPSGSASSNFTINAFAPTPGVHYLTVTAFAGTVSHSITITVDLTGPDFSIFAIPSRLTIAEGASALSTITLTGLDGFSSPILLATFSPYGLQSSVGPADVTLSSTVNLVTAGLNVTVPATLVPGSFYYITVTATNGILYHSVNVPVVVTGPDFTISADPTFLTIEQAKNATSTISLSSLDGFQGIVELSTNSFGGLSMSLSSTVTLSPGGTGTTTLTVSTTKSTPLGGYTFFVTGTSGILTHYTDVFVTVAGPDFRISANPNSFILMAGQKANSTISLNSIDNFAGIVKLSISANGVIASLNPVGVTLTSPTTSATSNLTITVPAALTPGIYGIGVTGVNGSLSHTIIISVEVIGPDFTIVSNPAVPSALKAGQTTLFTITLRSLLDFSGLVTLTISSPTLSASLSSTDINLAPGGQASADLNVTVRANTVPGFYTITVTGVSGLLSHATYISISVIGPDFSVGVVPFSGTVLAGTTGTFSVLLESLNGFSGTVNLSTTSTNGFTTTLNSGKITLPSGGLVSDSLAISVPANTLTGTYRVDITATNASGVPVHSTFIQLSVLAQNFTLITFPSAISIHAGAIGKSIVDVVGLNGFSGTVALTVSYNTQQLVVSLGSASLKLTPGFTNTTALIISTTTGTTPGVYQVVVNGTIGSLSRSVTLSIGVTAPSQIHPTSTTLVCGTPVVVNQASTCTATVTDTNTNSPTSPVGTVTFSTSFAGSFDSANCTLVAGSAASATCHVLFTPSASGTASISGVYTSTDATHDTSSVTFDVSITTVALDPTTTSISCNPNPVHWGSSTTCTATVTDTSSSSTPPTGTVSFTSSHAGIFDPASCTLTGATSTSCTVTYTPSVINPATDALPRSDSITGAYSGDTTHSASGNVAAPEIISVTKRSTSTTVSCDPSTMTTAESSTCTIQALDTDTQPPSIYLIIQPVTPSGTITVTFTGIPGATLGCTGNTCTCPGGFYLCTLIFASPNPGTETITATYSGNDVFLGSIGPATKVTVTPLNSTSTNVSCGLSTIVIGQLTTCTITVTDTSASPTTPTGNISFGSNAVPSMASCTLSGGTTAGTASCDVTGITFFSTGTVSITAQYPGDQTHAPSDNTASPFIMTVNKRPTTTTVSCLPSSITIGGSSICTATIPYDTTILGSLPPTGTVTFSQTGISTGTSFVNNPCTLSTSGQILGNVACTVTFSSSSPGTSSITGVYDGDSRYAGSSDSVTVEVASLPDFSITASPSTVPTTVGTSGSSTIQVTSLNGFTGDVALTSDNSACTQSTATVTGGSGTSTLSCTFATAGTVSVTVTGTSGSLSHSVSVDFSVTPAPDFMISASPTAVIVVVNSPGTSTITLSPLNGFSGTVALTTDNSACAVTPSNVTSDSTTSTISCTFSTAGTVVVTVTGTSGSLSHSATVAYTVSGLPDFTISASPTAVTATVGSAGTSTITISPVNGFTGDVALTSDNSACTLTPTTVTGGSGTSILSCTFNSAGSVTVIVTGTSGSLSHSTNVAFSVVSTSRVLLTFSAFDMDDFDNGVGQLQVFVNGHLVVDVPAGLNHLSGTGDYTPYSNRWVKFGPFDISSFVVNGQNNVTFTDLNPADHFGLVRNVMIVQGLTVLLNVGRTVGIYPGHSKTYTFSIPPLTIASFAISPPATSTNQILTFTATYTGGTAPFTCAFRFGDGKSVTVAGSLGTCTVTHEYNQPGTFMATVTVRGSSTSDIVRSSLAVNVT